MAALKEFDFLQLFVGLIDDSKSGRRVKKDGNKIRPSTIEFYEVVYKELQVFVSKEAYNLRIRNVNRFTTRQMNAETRYWKRFYKRYSDYLYSQGCYDNYVGSHFKVIRTFFNYLKIEKGLFVGDFHKLFYVRTEDIPIVVLSTEQFQFLIHDEVFEESLPAKLKRCKDIMVFGGTVGLRYSDLMALTKKNIETVYDTKYLKMRSKKTGTNTSIKLPEYACAIIHRYRGLKTLLPQVSLAQMNDNMKLLCEKAGWTQEVGKVRSKRGVVKKVTDKGKPYRFCDLVSTHIMRRTSITTLLSLGMPESMVRKISGHAAGSKEFYKYVHYAQQFLDKETDMVFDKLAMKK